MGAPIGPGAGVSVVMCVHNAEPWLREAVASILGQSLSTFEFIVVDDGSTDCSAAILSSYDDPRIRVIHQENRGLAGARNTGTLAATGDYVAYMDADDVSEPRRLEVQCGFLDAHPDTAAVGCSVCIIDKHGRPIFRQTAATGPERCRRRLLSGRFYNYGSALVVRREAVLEVGLFRTFFQQREDQDLMLRLAERANFDNVADVLYRYRINPVGLTHHDLRIGAYYRDLAFAFSQERQATGSDRLQRGEPVRPFAPDPGALAVRSSLRRVLAGLHLGEAELRRECGRPWSAALHVLRALTLDPWRRSTVRGCWKALRERPTSVLLAP